MHKKLIPFFIIMLFLGMSILPSFSTQQIKNEQVQTINETITFSTPDIKVNTNDIKSSITLLEANSYLQLPGKPILPCYTQTYSFPTKTTIHDITIQPDTPITTTPIQNDLTVSKAQLPPGKATQEIVTTSSLLRSVTNTLSYPHQWYEYTINNGIKEGEPSLLLTIQLYPVRIQETQLYSVSSFTITITYEEPVDNKPTNTHGYDLLIISPQEFIETLAPLVDHKESKGIATQLVSLQDIYDGTIFETTGRDEAEQIKYFIKNAYDTWDISYVLLVGGRRPGIQETWYCPVRYAHIFWVEEGRYVSDLYYADLYDGNGNFSTWDTDENNVFSEWKNNGFFLDDVDMYPEVYVGRLPCRYTWELQVMVDKIIFYENNPSSKKIILSGGDDFEEGPDYEGEVACEKTLDYLQDYEVERVYASQTDVTTDNIIDALGTGATFIHLQGHGSPVKWSTHKPDGFDEWEAGIGTYDIMKFSNEELPIIVIGGCHTAMFNVSFTNRPYCYGYIVITEGIAWWFARKIDGGGIASLGYTCYPTGSVGENGDLDGDGNNEPDCVESGYGFMQLEFFKAHGQENYQYLGECWGYAISSYLDHYKLPATRWNYHTIQGFALIGDPSLKIGGYP